VSFFEGILSRGLLPGKFFQGENFFQAILPGFLRGNSFQRTFSRELFFRELIADAVLYRAPYLSY
jgi:hypothetical protein